MTSELKASAADPFGLVGTLLDRKYRVDRVVAEGGFGVVYAGHHLGLDARIAIKALRPGHPPGDESWGDALAQFMTEAKTLAMLRSASVVTVYDVGVTYPETVPAGVPWLVLEWIEGETLQADLDRRRGQGGRTPAECLTLLRDVLAAIAEAHESGIAHRDLKPSNVMLERTRHGVAARVLDFGIAKIMEKEERPATGATATAARFKAYSPAYAAPEQVSGMRTGPWTDVHALGLILTEVLTDRPPYPTGNPNEIYRSVFEERRPTPGRYGVDAGAWEGVIARALSIKPGERFASAGELLEALQANLPGSATGPSTSASPAGGPASGGGQDPDRDPSLARGSSELAFAATERKDRAARAKDLSPARRGLRGRTLATGLALLGALAGGALWLRARARATRGETRPIDAPTTVACTTNAACTAAAGRPSVCPRDRDAGCVALESEDCRVHAEAAAMDSAATVWMGTLFPLTGPAADDGAGNTQAVELARRDFAQITAGMTAQGASMRAPPFGLIACDDATDARRAAQHLVDVGVTAVIGFRSGAEAIELASSHFIPHDVLSISATSTNPLVTRVPQPPGTQRLVWRTTYNALDTAHAMSAFLESFLEPRLRAEDAGFRRGRPLRVALVRYRNVGGEPFANELFQTLRYNGKSAFDNGADYREITYDAEQDFDRVLRELAAYLPQVILYVARSQIVERVFSPLERTWPTARAPRPSYVSEAHLYSELLDFIAADPDRRRRFFGMTVPSQTPENRRFVMHYNETFDGHVSLTEGPNTAYDAFYALAFAAYASDAPVTGSALSRALDRLLPPGRAVEVGMTGILDAISALRAGAQIDLAGSSGGLDFDRSTGEAQLDQVILCAAAAGAGGAPSEGVESGLVYRTRRRALEGVYSCK